MLRILTTASALALAAALPATAQDAQTTPETTVQEAPAELGPSAPEPAAPVVTPEAPSAAMPAPAPVPVDPAVTPAPAAPAAPVATPAPVDPAAAPAAPAPIAAAEPTKEQQVNQIVDAEFASYDGDGDGNLTKAEFAKWIIAMRDAAQTQGAELPTLDKASKDKWANAAFTSADTDKSRKISKVEMSSYLLG